MFVILCIIVSALIIIGGICLIVYISTIKDEYDLFNNKKTLRCFRSEEALLDFETFIKLYNIKPERWKITSEPHDNSKVPISLYYRANKDERIRVLFSLKNFLKFKKFCKKQGTKEEVSIKDKNLVKILVTAQEDIKVMRTQAEKEILEATKKIEEINLIFKGDK